MARPRRGKLRLDLPLDAALVELCDRLQQPGGSSVVLEEAPPVIRQRGTPSMRRAGSAPGYHRSGWTASWFEESEAQMERRPASGRGLLGPGFSGAPGRKPSRPQSKETFADFNFNEPYPTGGNLEGFSTPTALEPQNQRPNTAPAPRRQSSAHAPRGSSRASSKESSGSKEPVPKTRRKPSKDIWDIPLPEERREELAPAPKRRQFSEAVLAHQLRLPFDVVSGVCKLFKDFASNPSADPRDSHLDREQFATVLCKLCNVQSVNDLDDEFVNSAFKTADADHGGRIELEEFVRWYSVFSFSEEVVLNHRQQSTRILSRELGIEYINIEDYRRAFDMFDLDGSGEIDIHEFENLVNKLLKVPQGSNIPKQRMLRMFNQADASRKGKLDFPAFSKFYASFFE